MREQFFPRCRPFVLLLEKNARPSGCAPRTRISPSDSCGTRNDKDSSGEGNRVEGHRNTKRNTQVYTNSGLSRCHTYCYRSHGVRIDTATIPRCDHPYKLQTYSVTTTRTMKGHRQMASARHCVRSKWRSKHDSRHPNTDATGSCSPTFEHCARFTTDRWSSWRPLNSVSSLLRWQVREARIMTHRSVFPRSPATLTAASPLLFDKLALLSSLSVRRNTH